MTKCVTNTKIWADLKRQSKLTRRNLAYRFRKIIQFLNTDEPRITTKLIEEWWTDFQVQPRSTMSKRGFEHRSEERRLDREFYGFVVKMRIFAEMPGEPLAPDGLKVDTEGNVYVTGKDGIWVLDPDGRRLGVIPVPELPANLCWGDNDWQTLYIAARTSIYRVRLNISGVPLL